MPDDQSSLATELELYAVHKHEWLEKNEGKYVVAQEKNVLGFYDSFESALKAGIIAFGVRRNFLIKQVLAKEPVHFIF